MDSLELAAIRANGFIRSRSPRTYFSPDRYDDAAEAQRMLALPYRPEHRVGPISTDLMPDFDAVPLQPVPFEDPDRPGGGLEAATTGTVYLFGAYDFGSGQWTDV